MWNRGFGPSPYPAALKIVTDSLGCKRGGRPALLHQHDPAPPRLYRPPNPSGGTPNLSANRCDACASESYIWATERIALREPLSRMFSALVRASSASRRQYSGLCNDIGGPFPSLAALTTSRMVATLC